MKKYTCILAFGDSLVAGSEADEKGKEHYFFVGNNKMTIKQMDDLSKPYAFPQIVANKLDIPCHNFAMSGGSNERSLRLLIKNVSDYKDCLILFGYTSHIRKEYYYPLPNNTLIKDESNFAQVGSIVNLWYGQEQGKYLRSQNHLNEVYIKHFLHEYDNLAEIAMCVESICNYHSLDVVHLPLMKFKSIYSLSKKLPRMNLYDFDGKKSFEIWYHLKKYKIHEYGHPEHKAHIDLADKLVKYIEQIQ